MIFAVLPTACAFVAIRSDLFVNIVGRQLSSSISVNLK